MMLPTHLVVGLAVAAPLLAVDPSLAPAALAGAAVGSVFPDLDLYSGHRRTLHFPTGYTLLAVPLVLAALSTPVPWLVGTAFAALGAALHSRMDRYGGGLELEPWQGTSQRAVYDHVRGEWRAPKRWIRYDGSPRDALLASGLGLPVLLVLDGPFAVLVAGAIAIGTIYAALRRDLAALAPRVFALAPAPIEPYVPARYRP